MDVRAFIQDRIKSAGAYLLPSVRPLIVPDEHGDPIPAGSAVLLWYRGQRLLASAAHVLDAYEDRQYYVGTQTAWVPIDGPFKVTPTTRGGREEDHWDFGFREITDDVAARLDGCHFLTPSQIAENEQIEFTSPRRSKYLAIGYPLNRFDYNWRDQVTVPGTLAVAGAIAPPESFIAAQLAPNTHVLLEIDPEQVVGPVGVQIAPDFVGLSGGGVFRFPSLQHPGLGEPPQLVAITIEQRREQNLVVATRLDVMFRAIDAAA